MRKVVLGMCTLSAAVVATLPLPAEGANAAVSIQGFAFNPRNVTIAVGESVTWTNRDTVQHTATADDGSWTTPNLGLNQSNGRQFPTAGTFPYHCEIHDSMTGTVTVVGSGPAPTQPPATAPNPGPLQPGPPPTTVAPRATTTTRATSTTTSSTAPTTTTTLPAPVLRDPGPTSSTGQESGVALGGQEASSDGGRNPWVIALAFILAAAAAAGNLVVRRRLG